jgi:hypothetical protein
VTKRESHYRDVIERNGFVVTVTTDDEGVDLASDALVTVGASDVSVLRERGDAPRTVRLRNEE